MTERSADNHKQPLSDRKAVDDTLRVIIVNESVTCSIVTDIVSFGAMVGSFAANHLWLGDSTILALTIAICFCLWVLGKTSGISRKMTPEQALDYLSTRGAPRQ